MQNQNKIATKELCYHCGEPLNDIKLSLDGYDFCCTGCKSVYKILSENNLCNYYSYNE